ncbi:MAG TPA: glycosyltransferase family 4 protein [Sedimentibacter sp.]|nr:glycosyltransferase family 4 protein [Sedimentibacter sp.]
MEQKYNILIIHNEYQYAGGEDTVVKNEFQLLGDHGHTVTLYKRNNQEIGQMNILQKICLPFTTFFSFKSYREVSRLIKNYHIDIVHVHNTLPLISYSVYYAAKRNNCKLFQTIHNFRLVCPNGIMFRDGHICEDCVSKGLTCSIKHSCYRNSKVQSLVIATSLFIHRKIGTFDKVDKYLPLTEFNKNKLLKIIPAEKIFVKPNFIDIQPYTIVRPSDTFANSPYFIYASRVEKTKGVFVVLEAFRKLKEEIIIIIGDGPDIKEAKEYVREHHLVNVIILGQKTHEETLAYIKYASAMIFASQWYEGFPMTIVESFALSTPVIGSDTPNISSAIRGGFNGYTFIHNSSKDLCAKIKLYKTCTDTSILNNNAYNTFLANYTTDKIYKELYAIYSIK